MWWNPKVHGWPLEWEDQGSFELVRFFVWRKCIRKRRGYWLAISFSFSGRTAQFLAQFESPKSRWDHNSKYPRRGPILLPKRPMQDRLVISREICEISRIGSRPRKFCALSALAPEPLASWLSDRALGARRQCGQPGELAWFDPRESRDCASFDSPALRASKRWGFTMVRQSREAVMVAASSGMWNIDQEMITIINTTSKKKGLIKR